MCLCDNWHNYAVCPFIYFWAYIFHIFCIVLGTVGIAGYGGRLCHLGEQQSLLQSKTFERVE